MNACRGEHSSFLSARGFPIVWNKLLLWYNSLLVGMLLCLDSSFLALQMRDRIMGTCDCASLWLLLPPFCSRVFRRRRRWAVAKESAVWGERDIIFWNVCLPESPFCWCGWTAAKWCLLCLSKERLSLSSLWMWNQACSSQEEQYLNINSQTVSVANSRACCWDWLCRAGLYHPSTPIATRTSSFFLPANLCHSNLHTSLQDPHHNSGCISNKKEKELCLQMP